MFDKFIMPQVREEHHHSGIFTVNHHHAPTDESVKLLNEFQQKATENLISKFEIKGNILNACSIFVMHEINGSRILRGKFKLNDKEYQFEETFDYFDFFKLTQQELGEKLVRNISEAIALELIKQSNKDWVQFFFRK